MTVVGASAAGLYAAYLLARGGASVTLLERTPALEPAERTLIVTQRMREILGGLGEPSIVNEIRCFELFTDGRRVSLSVGQPDLIIERAKLVRHLALKAQQAGCVLSLGRCFRGLDAVPNGLTVEAERSEDGSREEVRAESVIGADGAASAVAQFAGWPRQPTIPLIQAIVSLPKDMSPDTVRVWFIPDDTPYFYWLIPESRGRGALGLIGETGNETRVCLERFMVKKGLEPLCYQGARIPLYGHRVPVRRDMGAGRVYLVGDAAGQVKMTTVGGVVAGFRGAAGVAQAILNGGASRELRSLKRELDLHMLLRRCLHPFQQADYSRLVDMLNHRARRSLGQYSRDDALKVLWHVCVSQPRLLLLALRGLLACGRMFGRFHPAP